MIKEETSMDLEQSSTFSRLSQVFDSIRSREGYILPFDTDSFKVVIMYDLVDYTLMNVSYERHRTGKVVDLMEVKVYHDSMKCTYKVLVDIPEDKEPILVDMFIGELESTMDKITPTEGASDDIKEEVMEELLGGLEK